jgi:hypothetical protein
MDYRRFGAEQRGPASHVTLSTTLLHTEYDVSFDVTTLQRATAIMGATVHLVDSARKIVATEPTSTIRGGAQDARLDIPSDDHRIQMVATAGAAPTPRTL